MKGKVIPLKDGRRIGYVEYGNHRGNPIFFFHGWPGSRYSGKETDEAAKKLNIRVISADRPGMGLSTFKTNRKLLDWPDDVIELANLLKIKKFSILGVSGGGPYVAACCYKIPERITKAGIVVGLAPVDIPGNLDGVGLNGRLGWSNYHRFPITRVIGALGAAIQFRYCPPLGSLINFAAKQDRQIYNQIRTQVGEENGAREAFAQGIKGPREELRIYTDDWGFDLGEIKTKLFLWYGAKDKQVSLNQGKYYHRQIKGSKLFIDKEASHLSRYYFEEKILRTII
jgi:pimeloyl-ACP methyl ester carboxylesterase